MSGMQACCPTCGFDVATPVTQFTSAPSPFFILITTNGRVSTSDDDLLSHYLQGVRADISVQDDVIQRIKSALTRAENEKSRLQGVFDSHAALRSPVRKCPPEVLTEIFHWTITTPYDDNHLGLRELNARLSKISAVCCLWRTTVLSSLSLWARFCLVGSGNEGLMPLLQTVLDRSREASLCIYFHPMFDVDIVEDAFLRRALGTSPRWKRARIELGDDDDIDIYAQIRGRLPRLEWLELRHYFDDVSPSDPLFDAFQDAPQLRALVLDGNIPVQTLALPWTQIISLDINYVIDRDDLSAVLSMTPNLQVLTLDYDEVNRRTDGWESKKSEDIPTSPISQERFTWRLGSWIWTLRYLIRPQRTLFFRALLSTGDKTDIQSVHITLPYLSLLRRQSFQARLKNLPDLLNFISIRDEIYTSFICMVR
ncbi:hypothetical protein EV421DRAFT_1830230 [Armillaria borealis]|uniref:F-box domain-containing protein n=1 Tax=Armillaria borealis TaxID=47425 RepID=A0AA39J795_9AGAR|nr:hypothetical protein EV421DRAFT_1830230 [Armillaria borealis]